MPDPIDALSEATGARLERLEKRISEYQASTEKRLDQITKQLAQLTSTVSNQAASIDRLERSVDRLITGIDSQRASMEAQRATMADFLALARLQAQTIDSLAKTKAA